MRAAISGHRIGWTPGREAVTENCSKAGEVDLKVPRLRSLPFETEIIRRYQTKQSSVEEALIEMYLSGVSVRRVEDITEALWGAKVSPSTVSDLNQKIYGKIEYVQYTERREPAGSFFKRLVR